MNPHFVTYSATGNIIGVAYYSKLRNSRDFVKDRDLRQQLKILAQRQHCDSVMVATPNSNQLEVLVFEPNSLEPDGGISVMCGNGVRAVAEYARQFFPAADWPLNLKTQSGLTVIEKISKGSYKVQMGRAVTGRQALQKYISPKYFADVLNLVDVDIPRILRRSLPLSFAGSRATCSIGYNSNQIRADNLDGEPHLVVELDGQAVGDIFQLRSIAELYGPVICNNRQIFPQGINVNFIVSGLPGLSSFLICTFERNLGDDPKKSVTQACGTGSTFAGSQLIENFNKSAITAQCLGGELFIEKFGENFYMSGTVKSQE